MPDRAFWWPMAASLLAATVTTIGLLTIRRYERWARENSIYFVCFAAGVLVSVSFMHIVPKAMSLSSDAPWCLLVGFFVLHGVNRLISGYVCVRPTDNDYALGLVPLVGIGLHSLIDGVVYSITFSVSTYTGALAASGMVLHEFPEGIVTYMLLIQSGFTKRTALLCSFAAAALSTPAGTLVPYPFIHAISRDLLGGFLIGGSLGAIVGMFESILSHK